MEYDAKLLPEFTNLNHGVSMYSLQGVINFIKYLQVSYFPLTSRQKSVAEFRRLLRSMGMKTRWTIRTYRIGDKYMG